MAPISHKVDRARATPRAKETRKENYSMIKLYQSCESLNAIKYCIDGFDRHSNRI